MVSKDGLEIKLFVIDFDKTRRVQVPIGDESRTFTLTVHLIANAA